MADNDLSVADLSDRLTVTVPESRFPKAALLLGISADSAYEWMPTRSSLGAIVRLGRYVGKCWRGNGWHSGVVGFRISGPYRTHHEALVAVIEEMIYCRAGVATCHWCHKRVMLNSGGYQPQHDASTRVYCDGSERLPAEYPGSLPPILA